MTKTTLAPHELQELQSIVDTMLQDALNGNSAYSKLWSIPGNMTASWCPWRHSDNWDEDDLGYISDPKRREAILNGEIEPNEEERRLLGVHYCSRTAQTDPDCEHVGIAPFETSSGKIAYVVFLQTNAYDPIVCIGIFASKDEAVSMVEREGAIGGWWSAPDES